MGNEFPADSDVEDRLPELADVFGAVGEAAGDSVESGGESQ